MTVKSESGKADKSSKKTKPDKKSASAKPKSKETKTNAKTETTAKTTTKTKNKAKSKEKQKKVVKRIKSKEDIRKHKKKTAAKPKKTKITKAVKKATEDKKTKPQTTKPKEVKFISGTKEVNLYSIGGKSIRKIKLPIAFDEIYRLDLIRRAVKASQANRRQPYGPAPRAGMSHPSSTWGKGRGAARVQRQTDGRRAVESPNNVGGRRAHPPYVEKVWSEKINKKERLKARKAALAAITDSELVANRGHKFDKKISLPLLLEDEFEKINKTKKTLEIFKNLGIYNDIVRAENGKHIRAGKGKSRGRKYRKPKSILIVTSDRSQLDKGTGNLIGVDVITPDNLSVEDLAPGGDPGRLTIITESALKLMGNW